MFVVYPKLGQGQAIKGKKFEWNPLKYQL